MTWDAATIAAANGPVVFPFFALQMALPAYGGNAQKNVTLLDGAGTVTFGGSTYVGSDPDFGSWSNSDSFQDGIALQSSRFQVTLSLLTPRAVAQVGQPGAQGSPVAVYLGFINRATGQPVSTPVTMKQGFLDTAKITVGPNTKAVDIDVVGAAEFLMMSNDGQRLNLAFQSIFFPADTGFAFVDNVNHQLPWGQSGPRPDQVTAVRNYDTGFSGAAPSYGRFQIGLGS